MPKHHVGWQVEGPMDFYKVRLTGYFSKLAHGKMPIEGGHCVTLQSVAQICHLATGGLVKLAMYEADPLIRSNALQRRKQILKLIHLLNQGPHS
jgi:hypothetical protein